MNGKLGYIVLIVPFMELKYRRQPQKTTAQKVLIVPFMELKWAYC